MVAQSFLRATKRRSAVVKELTNFNERIEDQNHLAETYRKWIDVVAAKQRSVIHRGLFRAAVIVVILLIGIFFDSLLKHLLKRVKLEQRQADTLHAVKDTSSWAPVASQSSRHQFPFRFIGKTKVSSMLFHHFDFRSVGDHLPLLRFV
jgi:hypothetical protein